MRSLSTLAVATAQDPSPSINRALFSVNPTLSAQGTRLGSRVTRAVRYLFMNSTRQARSQFGGAALRSCPRVVDVKDKPLNISASAIAPDAKLLAFNGPPFGCSSVSQPG